MINFKYIILFYVSPTKPSDQIDGAQRVEKWHQVDQQVREDHPEDGAAVWPQEADEHLDGPGADLKGGEGGLKSNLFKINFFSAPKICAWKRSAADTFLLYSRTLGILISRMERRIFSQHIWK